MVFPLPATLKNQSVNIRPAPVSRFSLGRLDRGDTVQVLNIFVMHGEGWCHVYYEADNIEGYILKKYLSIVTPEPVLTASPLPQLTASPVTSTPIPVTPTPVPVTPMPVPVVSILVPISPTPVPNPVLSTTQTPQAAQTLIHSDPIASSRISLDSVFTALTITFWCVAVVSWLVVQVHAGLKRIQKAFIRSSKQPAPQSPARVGPSLVKPVAPPPSSIQKPQKSVSAVPNQDRSDELSTLGMEWFPEMVHYDLSSVIQTPIPAMPAEPEVSSVPKPASVPSPETPAVLLPHQKSQLPKPLIIHIPKNPHSPNPTVLPPEPLDVPTPIVPPSTAVPLLKNSSVSKPMVDPPHEKPVFSDPSPYQELSHNVPYTLPPPLPPRKPSVSHAQLKQKKPKKKTTRPFNYNPEPESSKRVGSLPVHPVSWPRYDTSWQMLPFGESSRLQSIDDRLLRYRARKIRSKKYIGLDYERFIGYLLESNGYSVMYNGALKGVKDGGIDLIASKENDLLLIQCKLYKRGRNIPSGYAYRLKASVDRYCQDHPEVKRAVGYLVTNYAVSAKAQYVADTSGLQTAIVRYDRYYPCVKCVSFNTQKGARRSYYYMPWQASYDKVNVLPKADDCYVFTAREAESLGYHYRGRKYT